MEHIVTSSWRGSAQAYRIIAYGLYLFAVIIAVTGILFFSYNVDWREFFFLEACAVLMAAGGFFTQRLSKRYNEQANIAPKPN